MGDLKGSRFFQPMPGNSKAKFYEQGFQFRGIVWRIQQASNSTTLKDTHKFRRSHLVPSVFTKGFLYPKLTPHVQPAVRGNVLPIGVTFPPPPAVSVVFMCGKGKGVGEGIGDE